MQDVLLARQARNHGLYDVKAHWVWVNLGQRAAGESGAQSGPAIADTTGRARTHDTTPAGSHLRGAALRQLRHARRGRGRRRRKLKARRRQLKARRWGSHILPWLHMLMLRLLVLRHRADSGGPCIEVDVPRRNLCAAVEWQNIGRQWGLKLLTCSVAEGMQTSFQCHVTRSSDDHVLSLVSPFPEAAQMHATDTRLAIKALPCCGMSRKGS